MDYGSIVNVLELLVLLRLLADGAGCFSAILGENSGTDSLDTKDS